MKTLRIALFSLAGLLSLAAYSQTGGRPAGVKALKDNETRWNQEYAAKALDKIAAHYADDAIVMATGFNATTGTPDIHKMIKSMVDDPAFTLKFQCARAEVSSAGDLGFTQGSYQMTITDPASKQVIHDHGSYVTTYRKQADGMWKAVADIATSEVSPTTMASK